MAELFRGALYMLVLFSPLRSAFGHFQSQETKLDRALVHLSITTLCSHSADIQEPFFFPLRRITTEEQNKNFTLRTSERGWFVPTWLLPERFMIPTSRTCDAKARRYSSTGHEWSAQTNANLLLASLAGG